MTKPHKQPAFSLVEMLMALLVASLLMTALAPVMTKKLNDSMTVSIEGTVPGKKTKTHEILFDSDECPAGAGQLKTDADGSKYCEGEFTVPLGYNGDMKITVIGAGGGGAAASTAGYTEYTTAGSTDGQFVVPLAVNQIEATLVGGGAGGGAGGKKVTSWEKLTGGKTTWSVPDTAKNTYANVRICGAGGGKGLYEGSGGYSGGGSGAYISKMVQLPNVNSIDVIVGGSGGGGWGAAAGGGGASAFGTSSASYYIVASAGGGGGGHLSSGGGGGGKNGGNGGDSCIDGNCNIFSGGYGAGCSDSAALTCAAGGNGESNWTGSTFRNGANAASPTDEFTNNCGGGKNGAIRVY